MTSLAFTPDFSAIGGAPSASSKGYALTNDATGDAIAGGAQAAGGATKTLVSLVMGRRRKKYDKKIAKIAEQERRADFDEALKNSLEGEAATLRGYERAAADSASDLSARGMSESSARQDSERDMKFQRDLQLNAMRRARARLRHGFEAGEKIRELQKKIQKIEEREAVIAAGIDTVISVAGIVSDRNVKEDFRQVDGDELLDGILQLRVERWRYKESVGQPGDHMGPTAQDFKRIFGLGVDERRIEPVDALGVLFKAVQVLAVKVRQQERTIRELRELTSPLRRY